MDYEIYLRWLEADGGWIPGNPASGSYTGFTREDMTVRPYATMYMFREGFHYTYPGYLTPRMVINELRSQHAEMEQVLKAKQEAGEPLVGAEWLLGELADLSFDDRVTVSAVTGGDGEHIKVALYPAELLRERHPTAAAIGRYREIEHGHPPNERESLHRLVQLATRIDSEYGRGPGGMHVR